MLARRHLASACLLTLVLSVCSRPVLAFLDPPYITPHNPKAGELISVNIYGGRCDVVDDGLTWPPPITQQGNELTIHFTGISEEDPEWCYFGVGTVTYSIGRYPTGSYTLHVERRYLTIFDTWHQETLGVIPFEVTEEPFAQAVSAPALSTTGIAGLVLMIVGTAFAALRRPALQHG